MAEKDWVQDVLRFWFGELSDDDRFADDPAPVDRRIRERFLPLHERLAGELPAEARTEPDTALAAVIALDQFPRNLFRGTARAFASDAEAVALARNALDRGLDAGMPGERRRFLFMPLMHSENLADQERCVALFEGEPALADDVKYAVEHRDIVEKFGRFPHRNRVLGRESTGAERAFLAGHKGFGQ